MKKLLAVACLSLALLVTPLVGGDVSPESFPILPPVFTP